MLPLTFMRLRWICPHNTKLICFGFPQDNLQTFNKIVLFLYANLDAQLYGQTEKLHKVMPHQFVETFGHGVAVIIDCFEIFMEKLFNLKAHAQMFSSFKHNYTMQYLTGITPKGAVCFLSKGWEGRISDRHITLNNSFLDNLLPGDIVLVDIGFDIQENVDMLSAGVKLPALAKGQLVTRDLEVNSTF